MSLSRGNLAPKINLSEFVSDPVTGANDALIRRDKPARMFHGFICPTRALFLMNGRLGWLPEWKVRLLACFARNSYGLEKQSPSCEFFRYSMCDSDRLPALPHLTFHEPARL